MAAYRRCDVADSADMKSALEWTAENRGGVHILVNNAGIPLVGSVEEMVEALHARRQRWGLSYHLIFEAYADAFAPVLARLA